MKPEQIEGTHFPEPEYLDYGSEMYNALKKAAEYMSDRYKGVNMGSIIFHDDRLRLEVHPTAAWVLVSLGYFANQFNNK